MAERKSYVCDRTGATAPAENYNIEDSDFDLPRGWVKITVDGLVQNPELIPIITRMNDIAQIQNSGVDLTEDQIAELNELREEAEAMDPLIPQTGVYHISAGQVAKVIKFLAPANE